MTSFLMFFFISRKHREKLCVKNNKRESTAQSGAHLQSVLSRDPSRLETLQSPRSFLTRRIPSIRNYSETAHKILNLFFLTTAREKGYCLIVINARERDWR